MWLHSCKYLDISMSTQILKKPATTAKDYDGRPDAVIADELWEMHKKRNSSVCVEMMQGQLKYGPESFDVLCINIELSA